MPVTQPPYDATHFTLRQTRGEIGIFGSFTSAAAGWGYPCRRLRNLQIFAGESESPSCHTYFVGGAGPVRRARRSAAEVLSESAGKPRPKGEIRHPPRRL